jgi:anthranilate synthase/aminodeoxychorismate synthase-like glutamine amidotransferase
MILLVDNYDSFVHNLARYLRRLGQETLVVRNDAVDVDDVRRLSVQALVLSPGPKSPREAGCCLELVRRMWREVPILGICLGHQTIAAAFGARIRRAMEPMHGRTSEVWNHGVGLFSGLPNPLCAARYHSLVVDAATLPPQLVATAFTGDGTLMALQHRQRPVVGWQFHPESILTPNGYELLAAFLRRVGLPINVPLPGLSDEQRRPAGQLEISAARPVPV